MENLSAQDQDFVREVAITGNQTQSVKKVYGIEDDKYASVKGTRLIAKDSIKTAVAEVKRSLAERISTDKLEQVLNEGLEAYKTIKTGEEGAESIEPDFAVRHKYLDTALKIRGEYETDDDKKNINIFMPVLVKFLDKKNDTTSSDGDTN